MGFAVEWPVDWAVTEPQGEHWACAVTPGANGCTDWTATSGRPSVEAPILADDQIDGTQTASAFSHC
jgi:hypothetical protein